jgi:Nif-specific regulatory protein
MSAAVHGNIPDGKMTGKRFCTADDCGRRLSMCGVLCKGDILPPLFDIGKAIVESENLESTLSMLLTLLHDNMGVSKCMVNLYDSRSGRIFIHDSIGLSPEEETRGVYSIGEGITGRVVESGKAIIVENIREEPAFLNRTGSHDISDGNFSFVCMPIIKGSKVLGAISAERECNDPEQLKYDKDILGILSMMIAQAVELYLLEREDNGQLRLENERLQNALREKFHPSNIIGRSKPMLEVYSLIERISKTKSTVLLLGESGVGKELVANAIHYASRESSGPFVKFNCAALPESIIESELFGHEKGSFTGAGNSREGRFEEADGGTIFIDEIGELSLSMQAKLLRILQERTFERVGGNKSIQVDIRVIAATNKNLTAMAADGTFREDLYYRLNVFPIMIPPLRERGSDVITLADHFSGKFAKRFGKDIKRISAQAQTMLSSYSWPGNVRELENVIERAVILSDDSVIHGYNLPPSMQTPSRDELKDKTGLPARLDAIELEMISEALSMHGGNITAAARELGLTRRALGLRMEKFKLDHREFKSV